MDLKTERLILRPVIMDDAYRVQDLAGDIRVSNMTANIPHPYPLDVAKQWVDISQQSENFGNGCIRAITLTDTRELIGVISFFNIGYNHRQAEIGYWLGYAYWQKGYMTEALKTMLMYGFDYLKLHQVNGRCFIRNKASAHILEKVGFQRSQSSIYMYKNGIREPILLYHLLKYRWGN